jgi:hypothetical protein
VINTVLYTYLIGWIITSVGLALTIRDQSRPAAVIVAAGAVWPLLVLGATQLAVVALVTEVMRVRETGPKSIDDELVELLDEWQATGDAVARDRRLPAITGRDNAQ